MPLRRLGVICCNAAADEPKPKQANKTKGQKTASSENSEFIEGNNRAKGMQPSAAIMPTLMPLSK